MLKKKLFEASKIAEHVKKLEEDMQKQEEAVKWLLMRIPNIMHSSVPFGKDDKENVEVKKIGKPPKFTFEPKNHFEILEKLGLIDAERANKVSGHGFFYNKEELVILDFALQRYAIDILRKHGYVLINPPYMLRRKPYEGVTDLADFDSVLYKADGEDLNFIATAEHPMAAMYMDEVINEKDLPIKICGVSPCFRKEVGAHGKYTKGLYRMHQFHKVEQFIFCNPNDSWDLHEELQKNSEEILKGLGIHFRVVLTCTGDLGIVASKKYDNEFWMADGVFREIGSNSNCTDWQARRLNIKYREKEGQVPKGFVHTLNNTAIATSRVMIAIIEQFQQKDGSVKIPKVLWKYTGFKEMKLKK